MKYIKLSLIDRVLLESWMQIEIWYWDLGSYFSPWAEIPHRTQVMTSSFREPDRSFACCWKQVAEVLRHANRLWTWEMLFKLYIYSLCILLKIKKIDIIWNEKQICHLLKSQKAHLGLCSLLSPYDLDISPELGHDGQETFLCRLWQTCKMERLKGLGLGFVDLVLSLDLKEILSCRIELKFVTQHSSAKCWNRRHCLVPMVFFGFWTVQRLDLHTVGHNVSITCATPWCIVFLKRLFVSVARCKAFHRPFRADSVRAKLELVHRPESSCLLSMDVASTNLGSRGSPLYTYTSNSLIIYLQIVGS